MIYCARMKFYSLCTLNPLPPKNIIASSAPETIDMIYICISCGRQNDINIKDQMQCKYCACRVLEKKRPKRIVVIAAR